MLSDNRVVSVRQPGEHLVEIGTGWGGLAVHAAQHFGARVTTTTISVEQHRHATELVARLGLQEQVTVLLEDYRDLTGTYDKLVSVEMIEAVDWRDHDTFFATCNRLLKPEGRMAMQAITVADRRFARVRNSEDFVKRHIFPGSCIPSVESILSSTARTGDFWLTQLDEFPQHYAETLHRWALNKGRGGQAYYLPGGQRWLDPVQRHRGHGRVRHLNGGLAAWLAHGLPVTGGI